jgi:hypothetical protein
MFHPGGDKNDCPWLNRTIFCANPDRTAPIDHVVNFIFLMWFLGVNAVRR